MSKAPSFIEDLKQKVKNEKKETNNMVNKTSKKTIVLTVVATIVTLAVIAGLIYAGFRMGEDHANGMNRRVQVEAQALSATIAPSKQ